MSELKQKVISGILWQGLERVGSQGLMLLITILLARLLSPREYGSVALLLVFIAISELLANGGLGAALVQQKNISHIGQSSVFWVNIIISLILYWTLFLSAPLIARFYNQPQLTSLLRLFGIVIVLYAATVVFQAQISRKMLFQLRFRISLIALISSGSCGIFAAWYGLGAQALVIQQLINSFLWLCLSIFFLRWRPDFKIDFHILGRLFRYSSKILLSGILDTAFNNLSPLIIGKIFSAKTLGYYDRACYYPMAAVSSTNSIIGAVMFPVFSKLQDDPVQLKQMARQTVKIVTLLIFPLCIGIAATAKPFVEVLLSNEWLPCYPMMQVASLGLMFWPLHIICIQLINATGNSHIMLYLEILKKTIYALGLFITYRWGVMAMLWGIVAVNLLSFFANMYPNRKLLGYTYREIGIDIFPALLIAVLMGIGVWSAGIYLHCSPIATLVLQILLGLFLFILFLTLFQYKVVSGILHRITQRYMQKA